MAQVRDSVEFLTSVPICTTHFAFREEKFLAFMESKNGLRNFTNQNNEILISNFGRISGMAELRYANIKTRMDDSLAVSINQTINELCLENTQFTIFRIPSYIREINKKFCEPRIVSIGPYHHGGSHLKAMEQQKWYYVHELLSESPNVTLDMYIRRLRQLEMDARRCYHERIDHMDSDEFLTMLLLDSVFIIQVAVDWAYRSNDDVISDIPWSIPLIKSDLLMLENQIPFFVLQKVFELYSTTNSDYDESEKASLFDVLVAFLERGNDNFQVPNQNNNYDHLLHFYYHLYMSIKEHPPIMRHKKSFLQKLMPKKEFGLIYPRMIPCVTELKEAGITFERSDSRSIFGVKFSRGVLKIPFFPIEENARSRIMNLLAFEQCNRQKQKPLTSYVVFLDCIINTPRDVQILQQGGIMETKLGGEDESATFFNQLRYCLCLDYDEQLAGLFGEVKKYYESKWQIYRAKLRRDYFNSPWAIMAFFVGVYLLLLGTVQAVYAILAYHFPPH